VVVPNTIELFANIVLVTPAALTLNVSDDISIEELSTLTDSAVPAPPSRPLPAIDVFNWVAVIPAFATLIPEEANAKVLPFNSTVTVVGADPLKVKFAIPLPSVSELVTVPPTPVSPEPSPIKEPVNEPVALKPVAPRVLTTVPVPLLPTVVSAVAPLPTRKLPVPEVDKPVPPLGTVKDVSKDKDASSADDPETIIFFQFAIFYYKVLGSKYLYL